MNKLFSSKKGFKIEDLIYIGVTIAVVAIVLAISASIIANIQSTQTVNSTAYNASGSGLSGINTLASYLPTVALVSVAAIIIGLIMAFFLFKRGGEY